MGKETCPRCGSHDLRSWGSERRMCNNCGEIFSVEVREEREDAPVIDVTEKEDLEEFTYKPGAYLEQLKRERAQAEKEARKSQAMFAEMAEDLDRSGDDATHETVITHLEPEEEIEEAEKEEPEEESASAQYERLHAQMKAEQEAEARERKSKAAQARPEPRRTSSGLVEQLESIFSSKPATPRPTSRPASQTAATKKKKNTAGCVIVGVVILIVALSIICSILD